MGDDKTIPPWTIPYTMKNGFPPMHKILSATPPPPDTHQMAPRFRPRLKPRVTGFHNCEKTPDGLYIEKEDMNWHIHMIGTPRSKFRIDLDDDICPYCHTKMEEGPHTLDGNNHRAHMANIMMATAQLDINYFSEMCDIIHEGFYGKDNDVNE